MFKCLLDEIIFMFVRLMFCFLHATLCLCQTSLYMYSILNSMCLYLCLQIFLHDFCMQLYVFVFVFVHFYMIFVCKSLCLHLCLCISTWLLYETLCVCRILYGTLCVWRILYANLWIVFVNFCMQLYVIVFVNLYTCFFCTQL